MDVSRHWTHTTSYLVFSIYCVFLPFSCILWLCVFLLWPPCVADADIILLSCFLLFFFFSSPILRVGWLVGFPFSAQIRLYHRRGYSQPSQIRCLPYLHTWCGLSENLECRSQNVLQAARWKYRTQKNRHTFAVRGWELAKHWLWL